MSEHLQALSHWAPKSAAEGRLRTGGGAGDRHLARDHNTGSDKSQDMVRQAGAT